jgi:hypothetical protein
MADELPIVLFASTADLEAWLEENHASSEGIWLKIAKKGSGVESVNYAEALELALCFGWIDSQKRAFDEKHFLQRFTPRRPRGKWSRINRDKAEGLIAAGAMRPSCLPRLPGLGVVARGGRSYEEMTNLPAPPRELLADAVPLSSGFLIAASPTAARRSRLAACERYRARRLRRLLARADRALPRDPRRAPPHRDRPPHPRPRYRRRLRPARCDISSDSI